MRVRLIIIMLVAAMAFPLNSHGQVNVNYDYATIGVMATESLANQMVENGTLNSLNKIVKSYGHATVAMAGIYECKRQDRKALEDAREFASDQLYYYKLAYIYAKMIMSKVLDVSVMLIERPEAILQWGPYLYDVITKTKEHCQQFSAMVMNGKVTFSDILWLEFGDELIEVFNLMRLADYDWQGLIDNFSSDFDDLTSNISVDDILDVFDFIMKKGDAASKDIASAGSDVFNDMFGSAEDLFKDVVKTDSTQGTMKKTVTKIKAIKKAVEGIMDIYDIATDPSKLKSLFLEKLGLSEPLDPMEVINKIFSTRNDIDISSYVTNYNTPDTARYYTQMWHIRKAASKTEVACDYDPGPASYSNQAWVMFDQFPASQRPWLSETMKEKVLQNSEDCSGWSRSRVESLNTDPDVVFTFTPTLCLKPVVPPGNTLNSQAVWAAAYKIKVTVNINKGNAMYSALLNTELQDPYVFMGEMNKKLEEYRLSDPDTTATYYIKKDEPKYFDKPDRKKLEISSSVSFKAKCKDGGELSKGDPWFKVNDSFRHSNLNSAAAREQAIHEAMKEGVDPASLDTASINKEIRDVQEIIVELEREKVVLEAQLDEVNQKINDSDSHAESDLDALRKEQRSLSNRITSIEYRISELQSQEQELKDGRQEMIEDYYDSDNGDRIPSQENFVSSVFGVRWIEEGRWNGTTYTRRGKFASDSTGVTYDPYVVTFKAELSLRNKEKRILGIRIHRAQLQLNWVLTGYTESENTVDKMNIEKQWTAEEREEKVKERVSRLVSMYPDCSIEIEYHLVEEDEDEDEDPIHLLWPTERLDLARDLTVRLVNIYARLVEVERYIRYTKSVKQWLLDKLELPRRPPKRGNMADSCLREWINRAEKHTESKKDKII